jgi:hypothetical protein
MPGVDEEPGIVEALAANLIHHPASRMGSTGIRPYSRLAGALELGEPSTAHVDAASSRVMLAMTGVL